MILMSLEKVNKTSQDTDDEPSIIKRDKKMVAIMVGIYCNAKHKTNDVLCLECAEFLEYVKNRLHNCPYQAKKTACGICDLLCYKPEKKRKV